MLAMDDPHPYDILQGVSVSDVNIDPGADAFLAYWSPKLPSSKLQPHGGHGQAKIGTKGIEC